MNAITECLDQLPQRRVKTIVYVGARARGVVDRCRALDLQQLLVVCPDEDVAEELRRQVEGLSWVRVVREAVAPAAGPACWHRFNVRAMDSLLAPRRLKELYPRLEETSATNLAAIGLAQLLERHMPPSAAREATLLAIDLPGVEGGLLGEVAPQQLQAFGWIALAGVDATLYDDARPLADAVAGLERLDFRRAWTSEAVDPLWPAALMEFDASSLALRERDARLEAQAKELAALKAAQAAAQREVAELKAAQAAELKTAQAAAQREVAELKTAQAAELKTAQAAAQREVSELKTAQAAELETAQAAAQAAAQRELAELKTARAAEQATAQREIAELKTAQSAAQRELAELRAGKAALGKTSEELQRLTQERQARIDELTRARADAEALTRDKAVAVKARDEQARLAVERERRANQLEAELANLSGRHALLQEELVKAEAQIELIADLIWREGRS